MSRLCVTLTESSTEDMLEAMHGLPPEVDMVELRLDHMHEFDVRRLCECRDRPIIATNRPARQGGEWKGDEAERLDVLREAAEGGADYIDVELDSRGALGEVNGSCGLIVSHHDFNGTPDDIEEVHGRLVAAGADVVKLAVRATDIVDTVPVLKLLQECGDEVPTIALSMGEEGLPTRVLAPKFGGFLSFACPEAGREAAAGQVSYREMLDLYHFDSIGGNTAVYGVAADPVGHSMSPAVHNAAFDECGIDAVYLPLKVARPGPFLEAYEGFGLRGLSVTIPHKERMMELMDDVEDLSRCLGAINTVCIGADGRVGYNTDLRAAVEAIEELVRRAGMDPLEERAVMIVGAGGAGRAIAYGLAESVEQLIIANRTVSRAERLAGELGVSWCGLDEITEHRPDVIVNATSVGMHPHVEQSPVPAEMLRPDMAVFDSVYNPLRTRLLKDAEAAGAVGASGINWFVGQAAAQFRLWTGREAPRDIMKEAVRSELEG